MRSLRLASTVLASTFAVAMLATLHAACGSAGSPDTTSDAQSTGDAKLDRAGSDSSLVHDRDGEGPPVLVDLDLDLHATTHDASVAMKLVPRFSPDTHDYYVRCAAGENALRVSMTASSGATSSLRLPTRSPSAPRETVGVSVQENQAIVATATRGEQSTEYWVRCLPPDFPELVFDRPPEAGAPTPGYYLLGNFLAAGPSAGYAMILDGNGVPVWYHLNPTGGVTDVDDLVPGSVSYFATAGGPLRVVRISPLLVTTAAPDGAPVDFHELRVLSNGDYLIVSSPLETGADLTGLSLPTPSGGRIPGGPGMDILACNLVEFDPKTGVIAWTWKATDHLDPAKVSVEPILGSSPGDAGAVFAYDTFHCNSIDVDPASGNLLVSARQANSIFYLEKPSGRILWKMGGTKSTLDDATYIAVSDPFFGQHDARLQPAWSTCRGGRISLFDDETYGPKMARAMLFDVAFAADGGCAAEPARATVAFQHEGVTTSEAEGSFRISTDGSRVIGWGLAPDFVLTELDESGQVLLQVKSLARAAGPTLASYRAIKAPLAAFDLADMRRTAGLP
jgi:hypothetical protein